MQSFLKELVEKHRPFTREGKLADYIPQLAKQNPSALGVSVRTCEGGVYSAGDCPIEFTLQSISKVITLILALMDRGEEEVFDHVGMEPTGNPFNSIYDLEVNSPGKPLNPMINAGALVVSSLIEGSTVEERLERILTLVRDMAENPDIGVDEAVYHSERVTGYRNRSMAYFLKEFGIVDDVESTLELYFKHCSISVTCDDLARMGLCLARYGEDEKGRQVVPRPIARLVKTFMVTCGMYNASGEFAIKVGIPAKSGVSGGILASVPERMGIGVFGPALDEKGNSHAGVRLLKDLSREWNLSIF
ncbi:L-glutaminase [Melghirimyces profundicolus]|uniref:Glutaminase n=1 Tax=Melghirimyces profundicolus TaxID=1242148 RepID=A0A2T6BQF8_9BACL|nr:glutaminase A [Melghirimyces profundicolus]PTX58330.1 L-glutaminase [Melghirimyces profundicolus]